MIISHRHKFAYVKTRKTASTSLEIALSRFCGPEDIITKITPKGQSLRQNLGYPGPQNEFVQSPLGETFELMNHTPAVVARDLLGAKWTQYFTFTIERNPFDRAISQYFWEIRAVADPPPLSRFLQDGELLSNWPLYTDHDALIVDFVGRYETLEHSLDFVSHQLGLGEPITLPAAKAKSEFRHDRRHYREVLTGEDRRILEQACRHELEEFDFSW